MAYSTDMVERPRKLDDTIADLMGGNLTVAVIKHAVAELKRLGDIRRHMEHLRVERHLSSVEASADTRSDVHEMVKSYLAQEIANHVAKTAKITDKPAPYGTAFRAEAMMLPMALYEAVVPPAPQLNHYERNAKPLG